MADNKLGLIDRVSVWGVKRLANIRNSWIKAVTAEARGVSYDVVTGANLGDANDWNAEEVQQQALRVSWIYAAMHQLAQDFSSAKTEVKEIQGEEDVSVKNHPQEVLFRYANPYVDMTFIWQYTIEWLTLKGDGYWFLAPTQGDENKIAEIWPVPANKMTPIPDPKDVVKGYAYKLNDGQYKFIPSKYVVHFMYPNPNSLLEGLSPLAATLLAIETEVGTSTYQRDTYVTGKGVPHTVLTLPEDMGDRDFLSVSAQIKQEFAEERKIVIARAGDLKVSTVGLSSKEMDIVGQRKFTRDEIERAILGFPLTSASGTDFKEKYKAYKESWVYPLHRLLAGQVTLQLTQLHYGKQFITEFEDIRAQDRALNVQERNVYWRVATLNQARADLKQGPIADPDRLKGLGELLVPLATDPQFVLAYYGIGIERLRPGAQQNGRTDRKPSEANAALSNSDAPVNQVSDVAKSAAEIGGINAELDRLRKIAIKSVDNGINAGRVVLGFNTDILPKNLKYEVAGEAFLAKTTDEIKSVFENAKAKVRGSGRGRRNKETRAVNKYQSELEGIYEDWYDDWADDIVESDNRDEVIVAALAALLLLLTEAGRINLPNALTLAVGKEGTTPAMIQVLLDSLNSNETYLKDSLIPDLKTKLTNGLQDADIQAAIASGVGAEAVASLLATATARVGSYAGEFWKTLQWARGLLFDEHGNGVYWNRDDAAAHCRQCLEYGDQAYDSFAAMVAETGSAPSFNTDCKGNCRCWISEIVE